MPKYKKRKDGRYATTVAIGVRPDGRTHRKTIYAKTQRELEEKAGELRRQIKTGTIVKGDGVTVAEWAGEWLKTYKANVTQGTYDMYEQKVRKYILPTLGHMRLKDVKPFHIQNVVNEMNRRELTRATDIVVLSLKQIFKKAAENNLLMKSPAELIDAPKRQKPKKRALTDEERQYISSAEIDSQQRAFLYLMLFAGLRRGEALGLSWSDIDFDNKTVTVSKTWITVKNRPEIKPMPKSEAGNRTIPMPSNLYEVLKDFSSRDSKGHVFLSTSQELMPLSKFRDFWVGIAGKLNIAMGGSEENIKLSRDITPHIFRHSYATMLYYAGVDIKTAQYLLGHSSVAMTMEIYTHLDKSKVSAAANKIDIFLQNSQ